MNIKLYSFRVGMVVSIFALGEVLGRLSTPSEAQVAPPPATERTSAQIARERVKVAEEGYTVVNEMQQLGVGNNTDVAAWVIRRAHAASDLPDKAQRIAILEECAKRMTEQTRKLAEMQKTGTGSNADVCVAKFDVLEIELLLTKARESH